MAISDLPAELIGSIASHSSRSTLLCLRAVSKHISKCAEDAFLLAFYKHRAYLDTRYSLDNLLRISTHEPLRKRLKTIKIYIVSADGLIIDHFDPQQAASKLGFLQTGNNVDHQLMIPYAQQLQIDINASTSPYITLLSTALRNLHQAGIKISLIIDQHWSNDEWSESLVRPKAGKAYGAARLQRSETAFTTFIQPHGIEFPLHRLGCTTASDAFAFGTLAVANSGHPIESLQFSTQEQDRIEVQTFEMMPQLLSPPLLCNVRKFSIHVDLPQTAPADPALQPLGETIAAMTALKDLENCFGALGVNPGRGLEDTDTDMMCRWLQHTQLHRFSLRSVEINQQSSLQSLLQPHNTSLRTLVIKDAQIYNGGDWRSVLGWIAEEFDGLEVAVLWDLEQDGVDLCEERGSDIRSSWKVKGTVEVKRWLGMMAQKAVLQQL